MNNVIALPHAASRMDDDAWDDLLNFIEEKRVIPIVGPELLKVETDSGPRLLFDWLAEKLAAKLNVDISKLPQPIMLNDVVCWHHSAHGRREEAYTRLRSILREATFQPPIALRQLAEITDFDLYVSTTFDGLLEQAINNARLGGAQSTEVVSYAQDDFAGVAYRSQVTVARLERLARAMRDDALDYARLTARLRNLADIMLTDVSNWRTTYQARPLALPG